MAVFWNWRWGAFSRPFGTFFASCLIPSTSCWASFGRPFGTLVVLLAFLVLLVLCGCGSWTGFVGCFRSSLRDFLCFLAGTQHFVLGYFRSSLRDLLFFLSFLSFVGVFPGLALWGAFGRPFGTLALFHDDPCVFADDRFALLGWVVWFLTLERASYGIQIQGRGLHWLRRPAQ